MLSTLCLLRSIVQPGCVNVGCRLTVRGTSQQHRLISSITFNSSLLRPQLQLVSQKRYAARRGTRARKEKKKVKTEVIQKEFVPYDIRMAKLRVPDGPRRLVEKGKPEAIDDVYVTRHFMTKPISLAQAIQFHCETNHPTIYNSPEALIKVQVELDMKLDKKNRFLDNISRILLLPHFFELHPRRKILALCKTQETQDEAVKGGADAVGGTDLIKRIQSGEVALTDYDYYVAHMNMHAEVPALRGLMKKRLPGLKNGSMGADMAQMIKRFALGVEYTATKDTHELDYAVAEVPFGRLTMPPEELEANFNAILQDLESCRGRATGDFITRCYVVSPPSPERFTVNTKKYLGRKEEESSSSSDDESDDETGEKPEDVEEDDRSRVRASKASS